MGKSIENIKKGTIRFTLRGVSPLCTHNWSEKARGMIRDKHAGKKTKSRDVRDPEAEWNAAHYRTLDGEPAVPAMAIKSSIITASHKDIGIEKTLVKKALFLKIPNTEKGETNLAIVSNVSPIRWDEEGGEKMVRVGMGTADLRYRPIWTSWEVDVSLEVDFGQLTEDDVLKLVERAGFGVGIGEMRPEKGGELGRYEIALDKGVEVTTVDKE